MIQISFFQKEEGQRQGFFVSGHAGYAKKGNDIICAAVSALVINTINAIQTFTSDQFDLETEEAQGKIYFRVKGLVSNESKLLLDALHLGITEIQKEYGEKYILLQDQKE